MRLHTSKFSVSVAALGFAFALVLAGCESTPGASSSSGDASSAGLSIKREDGKVNVLADGKPLTSLYYSPSWDKPFLYPLISPSGVTISRGFPIATVPGEKTDHPWHRGIWWGHGEVSGEDFWRELAPDKSGKLVVQGEPEASAEGNTATVSFTAAMQGREPGKKLYGSVHESYVITRQADATLIDATIEVNADAGIDLKFGDTDDGGFAFRLRDAYRQDQGAQLINSEGGSGTEAIWGKPAPWIDYSANLDGKTIGVAVFDKPSNVRHPTGWHARGYALSSANPFALSSFAEDKKIDGSYTVKAGEKLTLQYRVVIHEGEFLPSDVNAWYTKWAKGN